MNLEEMTKRYISKLGYEEFDPTKKYTVRLWDGMDGCWCDIITNVDLEAALREWCARTSFGTKAASFHDIDYYRIFPSNTSMLYSGSNTMRGEA